MRKGSYRSSQHTATRQRNLEFARRADDILADKNARGEADAALARAQETVRSLSPRNRVMLWLQAKERQFALRDVDDFDGWLARDRSVCTGQKALYRIVQRQRDGDSGRAPLGFSPVWDIHQTEELDVSNKDKAREPAEGQAGTVSVEEPAAARVTLVSGHGKVDTAVSGQPVPVPSAELAQLFARAAGAGWTVQRTGDVVRANPALGVLFAPTSLPNDVLVAKLRPLVEGVLAMPRPMAPRVAPVIDPASAVRPQAPPAAHEPRIERAAPPDPIARVPDGEPGVDQVTLTLSASRGVISAEVTVNPAIGRVRYIVRGSHLAGAVTVMPDKQPGLDEPVPQNIHVDFGDTLDGGALSSYRADDHALVVNGIEIVGSVAIRPADALGEHVHVPARRLTAALTSEVLPDKTQHRVTEVVQAITRHFLARPDVDELRMAAARSTAPRRMRRAEAEVHRIDAEIVALAKRRTEYVGRAEQLRVLTALADAAPDPALLRPPSPAPVAAGSAQEPRAVQAQAVRPGPFPENLGPQWHLVERLNARVRELDDDQRRHLAALQATFNQALRRRSNLVVMDALFDAGRQEACALAAPSEAGFAAGALTARDLLDDHEGMAHYRLLVEAYARVLGPLHPDDARL